jgi:hypothetical protein
MDPWSLPWSPSFWSSALVGYLFSIAVETPVLLVGLSPRHPLGRRLFAGVWLTACTYPVVVLVLPPFFFFHSRAVYLAVAESFAPVAEGLLFWAAFGSRAYFATRSMWRDLGVIALANLASFGLGELVFSATRY